MKNRLPQMLLIQHFAEDGSIKSGESGIRTRGPV